MHMTVIYQAGFGPSSFEINYHVFTQAFCELVEQTMKSLRDARHAPADSMTTLLDGLRKLNQNAAGITSVTPINQLILAALEQLQIAKLDRRILMQHVAKIMMQCEFVGVKELKFEPFRGCINPQKLDELNYPEDLIPEHYLCAIQSVIMTFPVEQEGLSLVDMAAIAIHARAHGAQNMVTRRALPDSFPVNQDMSSKIELFIKKVQLIYYMFQRNDEYQTLYAQEMIQASLRDETLSYEEFRLQLKDMVTNKPISSAFFKPEEMQIAFPPLEICSLFKKYDICILQPSKKEYELLIRRIAAKGVSADLYRVLSHPVVDVLSVDIDATSSNGFSALDWINHESEKFLGKAREFAACRGMLADYKERHSAILSCS